MGGAGDRHYKAMQRFVFVLVGLVSLGFAAVVQQKVECVVVKRQCEVKWINIARLIRESA